MFVEIRNEHPMWEEFINYVKGKVPDAEIKIYEVSTYVDTKGKRLINFISCVCHEPTMMDRNDKGELISFPLDLFGTIYEM